MILLGRAIAILFVIVSGKAALAQEEKLDFALPSSLSFDFTTDSNKNTTSAIFADIGLASGRRLFIGASRSNSGDYKPGGISVGIGSDPLDDWVYNLMINTWGIQDEVSANSIAATIKYVSEKWDLQVTPRVRRIVGIFTLPARTEYTVMNTSLSLAFNYYINKNWQVTALTEGDNYDARLQRLKNNIDLVTSLAPNFGIMSQSFLQKLFILEISYHLKSWSFSLEGQRGTTAITESEFVTSTFRVFHSFSKAWSMELSAGNTRDINDTYGTNRFYGLSGTYSY